MPFQSLKQTYQKLQANPELSDHNKEVLDEFFRKIKSQAVGEPTIRASTSQLNYLMNYKKL